MLIVHLDFPTHESYSCGRFILVSADIKRSSENFRVGVRGVDDKGAERVSFYLKIGFSFHADLSRVTREPDGVF